MSRHTQPAVITVICDGCHRAAQPEPLDVLMDWGWTISMEEPSRCDWCPNCTNIRADLVGTIEHLREWCERGHYAPGSLTEWQRGFLTARSEVRAILDGGAE